MSYVAIDSNNNSIINIRYIIIIIINKRVIIQIKNYQCYNIYIYK